MDTHTTAVPAADQAVSAAAGAGLSESPAINELATALAKAQGAFSNPEKDRRNPHFGNCYATLGAVIQATREALAANGLSLTQTVGGRPPSLRTRLLHSSGQWLASEVPLFMAGKGSQVFGSELTYMRRYAVCALLNIAPAEGDDDGNAAQVAMGAGASSPQATRSEARPGNGGKPAAARGNGNGETARAPSRARTVQPEPAKSRGDLREAGAARQNGQGSAAPASPGQPAAAPSRPAKPQQTADAPRRPKDEAAPPSVWGILRPGKTSITAPDGTAWLNWWTGRASKAAAEGKRDELRTLYEANTAGWDQIALGSAEGHDRVAAASEAVRAALDG
jgi:hypothetical protein